MGRPSFSEASRGGGRVILCSRVSLVLVCGTAVRMNDTRVRRL